MFYAKPCQNDIPTVLNRLFLPSTQLTSDEIEYVAKGIKEIGIN